MAEASTPTPVSAAGLHAAKTLLKNFDIHEKPGGRVRMTERNLAILIDVCTQIPRIEKVMDRMVRTVPWLDKDELGRHLEQLREGMRLLELVRNSMPSYAPQNVTVIRQREKEPVKLNSEQARHLARVATAIREAKTPAEEQRVLRAAGLVG